MIRQTALEIQLCYMLWYGYVYGPVTGLFYLVQLCKGLELYMTATLISDLLGSVGW